MTDWSAAFPFRSVDSDSIDFVGVDSAVAPGAGFGPVVGPDLAVPEAGFEPVVPAGSLAGFALVVWAGLAG